MSRLWPAEDQGSPLAGAFDAAARPDSSDCALLVVQRDGESEAELEARARAEEAADKLGRHVIVVHFE